MNYRVDPEVIARLLPRPFRPQLVGGAAVAGICLIRLGQMRPRHTPRRVGLRSENAAHRVAVEWDTASGPQAGVFIPRRDSDSWVNVLLGGRLYPGEHHRARFRVDETDEQVQVAYTALDGSARVDVSVRITDELGNSRLFADLEEASAFFEWGSVGYSATRRPNRFDGLGLKTSAWRVEPTSVTHAKSAGALGTSRESASASGRGAERFGIMTRYESGVDSVWTHHAVDRSKCLRAGEHEQLQLRVPTYAASFC